MSAAYDFIRQLVHKRSAIVLEDEKDYLIESRLSPLIKQEGLGSFVGLVEHLKQNERGRIGVQVVEAMTTNETSFFRDNHPFETLRTVILPRLLEARAATRTLRIWSAASSTGQEALSIAMVLRDALPDLAGWDVKILATDLNRAVIARAATGVFKQLEVNRGLPARHLAQHFERCGADWKAKRHLLDMVTFRELNLLDRWRGVGQQDLVFMRNVLIYFDLATRRTILRSVSRLLPADGYLFLGGAETTVNGDERLRSIRYGTTLARTNPTQEMPMLPDDEVLTEITRSVWDAMLSMELRGPLTEASAASLWCAVDISGSWQGTVWLGLSPEHASAAAQVMLELPPGAGSDADAREVATELTNMLGGNIKGILLGQNRLSLPRVGAPGEVAPDGSRRLHFDSGRGTFSVAICDRGDGLP